MTFKQSIREYQNKYKDMAVSISLFTSKLINFDAPFLAADKTAGRVTL